MLDRSVAETGVEVAAQGVEAFGRRPLLLWVDDWRSNNRYEVAAFTSLGMHVQLSASTEDALEKISNRGRYDLIEAVFFVALVATAVGVHRTSGPDQPNRPKSTFIKKPSRLLQIQADHLAGGLPRDP